MAALPTIDAHDIEIRWPYAYVADGPGGLIVVDVRLPVKPRVIGGLALDGGGAGAVDLDVMFQFSRPMVDEEGQPSDERTPARRLVAVCDEEAGPILIDATEPAHLELIESARRRPGAAERRRDNAVYHSVVLRSHVDLASPQGGDRTRERDYMYFVEERTQNNGQQDSFLRVVDVTDPESQEQASITPSGGASDLLEIGEWYTPPFLRKYAFIPGEDGVIVNDMTNSAE
ncbi:hypothetical protein OAF85_01285, partial [Planctomycetota bacterium]|nr:hypothetical protein [Planctomycetota bacterium]